MTDNLNLNDSTPEPKLYEIGYLLSPLVPAETKDETAVKEINQVVIQNGGQIEAEIAPAYLKLAYPVSKTLNHKHSIYKEAYFGATRFTVTPAALASIKAIFDKSPLLLRFLITTAVPGSVFEVTAGKDMSADKLATPEAVVEGGVMPVVEEEIVPEVAPADTQAIDQEIDNLLVSNS